MSAPTWRGRASGLCRVASAVSAIAFIVVAVGALAVAVADAGAAPRAGTAEVISPQDATTNGGSALAAGSALTRFSLKLPNGAACTGDSANGGYRVQSFMVPVAIDPASLTFGALGPLPKGLGRQFRQPLFAVNTTPFANAATNLADEPDGPGVIINVPSFDFGVFEPADLPPGRYSIGVACTKGPPSDTQLDLYWVATLDLSTAADPLSPPSWIAAAAAASGPGTDAAVPTTADGVGAGGAPASGSSTPEPTPGQETDADAPVEGAAAPSSTVTALDTLRSDTRLPAYGGPPTFTVPALELASTHLTIRGNAALSLVLWLTIAVAFGRTAVLLVRTPIVTAVSL